MRVLVHPNPWVQTGLYGLFGIVFAQPTLLLPNLFGIALPYLQESYLVVLFALLTLSNTLERRGAYPGAETLAGAVWLNARLMGAVALVLGVEYWALTEPFEWLGALASPFISVIAGAVLGSVLAIPAFFLSKKIGNDLAD
ncbi:hypothetical protein FUAX_38040 [Fulvitalea axinellae]|uniref:Uncharacterized protein n=1 Tax=Fulvitalea axinellae TaxID=1182444 RepID=A0AAU9CWG1_9BACT|nr:hypothetical protein FUAX_38040 [Fulvitalea axinellae]